VRVLAKTPVEKLLATYLATGDPYDGVPPLFTAICRVYSSLGAGTGFFVGERRHIITARHVVFPKDSSSEPLPEILIGWVYTGSTFLFSIPATVVCDDWRTDLALLRLDDAAQLPSPLSESSLSILASSPAMLGDRVVFEGFRHIDMSGDVFCRVQGRVKHAYAAAPGGLEQRILTLDVTSWPGSSGSPVFSKPGQVVGVVTAGIRERNEAIFRDARWILQLLQKAQGDPVSRPAAKVIPFPILAEIPAPRIPPDLRLASWSQRLKRLTQRH
jgi:S1-C subfamily serine protease